MKKNICKIMAVILFVLTLVPMSFTSNAATTEAAATRAIYVVYDNSGSMYSTDNKAWSQAAYAMEVFAAMMNFENGDVMKIFPMHDVTTDGDQGTQMKSSIVLNNQSDIAQIRNMYTPNPGGTPYTQVNNASEELKKILNDGGADEGWLIVLTDGIFDSDIPGDGLRNDLIAKAEEMENLNVQYLAMGSNIESVPEGDGSVGFYSQKAETSAEVVNELAVISNRIFRRNEYVGYQNGNVLNFDIPLNKLIVFAQGKNVKVNALTNAEGVSIPQQESCEVSCSSTSGAGLTSFVTVPPVKDTSLKGVVTVFASGEPITEGAYTLDVSGADSIKLYYEPDVKFGVGLFKEDNQIVDTAIENGTYTLKVGFVNRLTGAFIEHSELLGTPEYVVTVNGDTQSYSGENRLTQEITLDVEGDTLEIDASVTYLNDYKDHAALSFAVSTLEMTVQGPEVIKLKEMENEENHYFVSITRNGEPLTEDEWNNAVLGIETLNSKGEPFALEWDVKKGSEVSTWILKPKYAKGDLFKTDTGEADVSVRISMDISGREYYKSKSFPLTIEDDKTMMDFLKRYWKRIVISLALLILFLGYIPPFKKRFSRKMKKRPSIECTSEQIGVHDMMVKGSFAKSLITVLLPYKAEEGRLSFSPAPVKKTAKIKATGGSGMAILNTSAFAGKEEVTFNGMSIPENYKGNYNISASTIIAVATKEFTYTCIPNVQKTADGSIKRAKGKKKR